MKWLSRAHPPWPVSLLLALCVLALAAPLFALIVTEATRLSSDQRKALQVEAARTAERIAADVDQTLNGYLAILATLATSPALAKPDLATVYSQATEALKPYGLYAFLRNSDGQQLFNTRVPYGSPLPRSEPFDRPLFETGEPYVSNLVIGDVAQRPVAAVSVPVVRNGKIAYVLSLSLEPDLMSKLLGRQKLPEDWSASITDRAGNVIAHSRRAEFLGKKLSAVHAPEAEAGIHESLDLEGRKVIWGHSRSGVSEWEVYVAISAELADAAAREVLIDYASVVGILTAIGLAAAFAIARLITRPLEEATLAARALGEGRQVTYREGYVKDANAIGTALVEAGRMRDEADQQILLLLREVNHRSKNMLAVVQAIARQMVGSDPKTFVRHFSDRIVGLAASQDLLIDSNWKGVLLSDLVHTQLFLFRELLGTRIHVRGRPVRLTPPAAQSLGMALHELATNAGKYGALSGSDGTVTIEWDVVAGEEQKRMFTMRWLEVDGPPVTEPLRRGFGYTIMVSVVERSLDAKVRLSFRPTGLTWEVEALAHTTPEGGDEVGPSDASA